MDLAAVVYSLHVALAFGFVLAHGVSVFVTLRLRSERDPERASALLDLSQMALPYASAAVILLILTGVLGGFMGNYWGRGWIWAAIGVLIVVWGWMSLRGVLFHDAIRHALGKRGFYDGKKTPDPAPAPDQLEGLLTSSRPYELLAVGLIGLAVIIWLMIAKPF